MSNSRHNTDINIHRVGKPEYDEELPEYIDCVYCDDGSCGLCEHGLLLLEDGKVPCSNCGGSGMLIGLELRTCPHCIGGLLTIENARRIM